MHRTSGFGLHTEDVSRYRNESNQELLTLINILYSTFTVCYSSLASAHGSAMSSDKNYLLKVSADEGKNLLTFTVSAHPSHFFKHVRIPLITVLVAYLVPQVYELLREFQKSNCNLAGVISGNIDTAILGAYGHWHLGALAGVFGLIVILISLQEQSDGLMVMEDMGVQLSSQKGWRVFNRGSNKEFIPRSDIIDIVIHEGFHGYGQVIFYMCILTKTKEGGSSEGNGIKVVFPNFLPRKDMLLQVWKQSRKMLYGDTRRHFRRVPGQGLREVKHLHE